jgi:hypothetical protein
MVGNPDSGGEDVIEMRRVDPAGCHGLGRDRAARLQKLYDLMILCHAHTPE